MNILLFFAKQTKKYQFGKISLLASSRLDFSQFHEN